MPRIKTAVPSDPTSRAILQIERRITGIRRCVADMVSLPVAMQNSWWRGQLAYFRREIIRLEALLRAHKVSSGG